MYNIVVGYATASRKNEWKWLFLYCLNKIIQDPITYLLSKVLNWIKQRNFIGNKKSRDYSKIFLKFKTSKILLPFPLSMQILLEVPTKFFKTFFFRKIFFKYFCSCSDGGNACLPLHVKTPNEKIFVLSVEKDFEFEPGNEEHYSIVKRCWLLCKKKVLLLFHLSLIT